MTTNTGQEHAGEGVAAYIAKCREISEGGKYPWWSGLAAALEKLTRERDEARGENTRLRAALAQSDQPCVYCSLPADEWAKCASGFPGCDRADDAMGCPELGARMEVEATRARIAALEAENAKVREGIEKAAVAGWEACRRSIYAVCEDVQNEADRLQISTKPGSASEEQRAEGYYAGSRYAAKSIARGFCAMSGLDDDNLTTAIRALGGKDA